MNILLFDIIINFYQGFLMIYYVNRIFFVEKRNLYIDILFVTFIGVFLCLYLFVPIQIPDTIVFIIPFIYAALTKRGTWLSRMFWIFVLGGVWIITALLIETIYANILNISIDSIFLKTPSRLGYVISSNIALTIFTFLLCNFVPRHSTQALSFSSLFIFMLLLLAEFFIAEMFFGLQCTTNENSIIFLISSIALLALVILSVLIYEIMSSTVEKKRIVELKLKTNLLSQEHQNDMKAMYEGLLTYQHDLRKRIAVAEQLINSGFVNNADNPIEHKSEWNQLFITGNMTVDAILTAKVAVMKANDIDFSFQPYPLQHLPINEQVFGIMLSNILDNAIEGVLRMSKLPNDGRSIYLKFARSWDMFFLVCRNPFDPVTIRKQGDKFLSSKPNAQLHGLGTLSIMQTVESNHGRCIFSTNNDLFTVKIVLPDLENPDAE